MYSSGDQLRFLLSKLGNSDPFINGFALQVGVFYGMVRKEITKMVGKSGFRKQQRYGRTYTGPLPLFKEKIQKRFQRLN